MLRSATNWSLRQSSRVTAGARFTIQGNHSISSISSISSSSSIFHSHANLRFLHQSKEFRFLPNVHWSRAFSSSQKSEGESKSSSSSSSAEGDEGTKEIVLTPGQKVAAASRLTMWAGAFGFACVCAYYIAKELIPTKMSPNTVFNGASAIIREHSAVTRQYGEKLKFYGKDHGGHREGRRNFIQHTEYTSPDDGSNRTRVRFNMEGQFHNALCFAEVSSEMPSGEFVYILVQDKQTGRVITVVDNRASLTARRLAGGNQDTANAMQQLLGGNGKGN